MEPGTPAPQPTSPRAPRSSVADARPARASRASVTVAAVERDDDGASSIFRLHAVRGPLDTLLAGVDGLLALIRRQWLRRQLMVGGLAVLLIGGGIFLLFEAFYLAGLAAVGGGAFAVSVAMSSGRHLEVEVETVQLVIALLEELDESLDRVRTGSIEVDMRPSSHVAKLRPTDGGRIVDHWFTLRLPLVDGPGLLIELTEHVEGSLSERTLPSTGKRMGRDYRVELYHDTTFDEVSLRESVAAHVSAPTATNLSSRVREGLDVFNAAIEQLRIGFNPLRSRIVEALGDIERHTGLDD